MKLSHLFSTAAILSLLVLTGCEKLSFNNPTSVFIPVENKNSSLYLNYSSTNIADCGTIGYNQFYSHILQYDSTEVLAAVTTGNLGGANNDTIFKALTSIFGIVTPTTSTIPYFQSNLDTLAFPDAINAHNPTQVLANSAYELSFTSDTIQVNTTTEFFMPSENETYYLSAYIVVDSLVANQAGHPDGSATNHRKVIVDIGRPDGYEPRYLGYKVATGTIEEGYKFNLTFKAARQAAWNNQNNISVALVLTRRDANGRPIFVNANTKH